ncbi:MAG: translocation/assembly module TamB domain-containing protein, partial [Prochlorothrix sp.]
GFVNTLGQGGDSTLALANLAGSALINNLQSAINNVLSGPVDFRLFPTIVDSNETKEQADNEAKTDDTANTLALGAELGINLTNSLSFSVLRLLTLDIPTRFNLRYQLNDNWQLRGASDFQGDNRMVVEYEARF